MTDDEVFRKHVDELMRFVTGLVGPFDAADVVNDACVSAFSARAWPEVADCRAYLYRSVLNTAPEASAGVTCGAASVRWTRRGPTADSPPRPPPSMPPPANRR